MYLSTEMCVLRRVGEACAEEFIIIIDKIEAKAPAMASECVILHSSFYITIRDEKPHLSCISSNSHQEICRHWNDSRPTKASRSRLFSSWSLFRSGNDSERTRGEAGQRGWSVLKAGKREKWYQRAGIQADSLCRRCWWMRWDELASSSERLPSRSWVRRDALVSGGGLMTWDYTGHPMKTSLTGPGWK